jgi:Lar family restriction alleviation protein
MRDRLIELLPCPFCGSADIELSIKKTRYPFWYAAMYCTNCNCYGARTKVTVQGLEYVTRNDVAYSKDTERIAIEAWNTRQALSKLQASCEQVKED